MYFVSFLSSRKIWPLFSWPRLNNSVSQHANNSQLLPAVGSLIPRFLKQQRPVSILMAETSWTNIPKQEISRRLVNNKTFHNQQLLGVLQILDTAHPLLSTLTSSVLGFCSINVSMFPTLKGWISCGSEGRFNDGHTGRFPFGHSHPKSDVLQQVLYPNTQKDKTGPSNDSLRQNHPPLDHLLVAIIVSSLTRSQSTTSHFTTKPPKPNTQIHNIQHPMTCNNDLEIWW